MRIVKELLHGKGDEIWSIQPQDEVYQAIELMSEKNIGALLVMNEGRLEGILSERDYARKVILQGRSSRETLAKDIMTSTVLSISSSSTIEDCMRMMTDHKIRHLPVVDDGAVIGVISIGDVVKAIISDQEQTIEQLERYIAGS